MVSLAESLLKRRGASSAKVRESSHLEAKLRRPTEVGSRRMFLEYAWLA